MAGEPIHDLDHGYIVIRFEEGYPEEWKPPGYDGRWIERRGVPVFPPRWPEGSTHTEATAFATGRYETNDDGLRAEVYEVRRAQ